MAEFTISAEHNAVRLSATIAFADTGDTPSRIVFYSADETPLVTVILAKPCGVLDNNAIVLQQADVAGDMIVADGVATRATWLTGNGLLVASGPVSDETGEGPFILQGAEGTNLYAGGRAVLGVTEVS